MPVAAGLRRTADSIPPSHAADFFALLGGGLRDAKLGTVRWAAGPRGWRSCPGMTHLPTSARPRSWAAAVADFLRVKGLPRNRG